MFNKPYSYTNYSSPTTSHVFPLTSKTSASRYTPLSTISSSPFLSTNTNYTDTSKYLENTINNNTTRNNEYEHKFTTRNLGINGESSKIDDYEIGQFLGSGGFADVYCAVAKSGKLQGKEVAVKMINKNRLNELENSKHEITRHQLRSRVEAEVKHHKQLSHPSILTLFDAFEDSKYVYLVMELCPKGELYKFIRQRKIPLCEAEARGVMKQLVEGIQYMHTCGIMHRDLKLSNILLTEEFDVKIADFGMSTNIFEQGEQETICGTPNYISPEIVSKKPYGLAVDVWSLGVMLVAMLTGKPPFEDSKVQRTLDKVTRADYKLPETLSNEARDLVNQLLQVDVQRRLQLSRVLDHPFFSKKFPIKRLSDFAAVRSDHLGFKYRTEVKSGRSSANVNYIPPSLSISSNANKIYESSKRNRLNTFHLKSQEQKTKHAKIEILASGTLYLDFFEDRYLMTISNDGEKINLFERPLEQFIQNHSATLINPVRSYTLDELPSKYLRRYQFVYKVVDLIKRKTPKAKCTLMENGPIADFEMCFQNQIKVYHSQSRGTLEIKVKTSSDTFETYKFIITGSKEPDYPRELLHIVKHMQDCLKQCLDIERNGRKDPNIVYPLILKSRSHVNENDNITSIKWGSKDNKPPRKARSLSVLELSTPATVAQPLIHTTGTRSDYGGCTPHNTNVRTRPFSTYSISGRSMTSSATPVDMTYRFIVNLGWCIRTSDDKFTILFEDGIRLVIESKNHSLKYFDESNSPSGKIESYPIDTNLPQYVKDKLAHFPKFAKLLDQQ